VPTIVATVGGASSNSFLTEARAETLIDELRGGGAWEASGDDDEKARSLITATLILDALPWLGVATGGAAQALAFPRTGLTDPGGFAVDAATIPRRIEYATAALALRLLPSNLALESAAALQGLKRLKADTVELEWRDAVEYKSLPADVQSWIPVDWLEAAPGTTFLFKAMGV